MDEHEDEVYNKLKSGYDFKEHELAGLLEFELRDERDEYDERRWSMGTYSILKIKDEYYGLNWDRGLTEMQENSFYDQPKRVKRVEKVVTQTIVTWEEVN